jgi:hypothetical protein
MFPGLASAPNNEWLRRAFARRIKRFVRPSKPAIGFASVTCSALAIVSTVRVFNPSASTWHGCVVLLLNIPDLNISRLAIANPSDLRYVRPFSLLLYDHELPAPASRRTETRKRSSNRRHRSEESTSFPQLERSTAIRSRPPTLKCCHLPCGGIEA